MRGIGTLLPSHVRSFDKRAQVNKLREPTEPTSRAARTACTCLRCTHERQVVPRPLSSNFSVNFIGRLLKNFSSRFNNRNAVENSWCQTSKGITSVSFQSSPVWSPARPALTVRPPRPLLAALCIVFTWEYFATLQAGEAFSKMLSAQRFWIRTYFFCSCRLFELLLCSVTKNSFTAYIWFRTNPVLYRTVPAVLFKPNRSPST